MAENEEKQQQQQQNDENVDYVAAIQELKENTVSKEKYEKLKGEKQKLLDALVKGEKIEAAQNTPKLSNDELRKKLCRDDLNQIEYWETTLELRKNIMDETGEDIFVAKSHDHSPTQDEKNIAQSVADLAEHSLEVAQGNVNVFEAEFFSHVTDPVIPRKRK